MAPQSPLKLIYLAMLVAQVMTLMVMVYLVSQGIGTSIVEGTILIAIASCFVAGSLTGAVILTNRISALEGETAGDPVQREANIRRLCIIRMAILEGGTMTAAVFYLLHPHLILLAYGVVTLTTFALLRPPESEENR